MSARIRVEVYVGSPETCQLAPLTTDGARVADVARSAPDDRSERVVEEFVTDAEVVPPEFEEAFSYDSGTVYRYAREARQGCVCEVVEGTGHPAWDVHAVDGALVLSFYASDVDDVREVVSELDRAFDDVAIRRLTRSESDRDGDGSLVLDGSGLTARQRQVLCTAHEMGYFAHPRSANGAQVAAELDISSATFREHLATAQAKLLDHVLEA